MLKIEIYMIIIDCFDVVVFAVECAVSRTVSQPFTRDLLTYVPN